MGDTFYMPLCWFFELAAWEKLKKLKKKFNSFYREFPKLREILQNIWEHINLWDEVNSVNSTTLIVGIHAMIVDHADYFIQIKQFSVKQKIWANDYNQLFFVFWPLTRGCDSQKHC